MGATPMNMPDHIELQSLPPCSSGDALSSKDTDSEFPPVESVALPTDPPVLGPMVTTAEEASEADEEEGEEEFKEETREPVPTTEPGAV